MAGPNPRTDVLLHSESITYPSSSDFPHHDPTQEPDDAAWDLAKFKRQLKIPIQSLSPDDIILDLIGVDAAIANAIRRVLMAEVPTVAIENVYVWNNTSIVQDEVLAQRLGLVPLNINPRLVDFKDDGKDPTDLNTFVFHISSECSAKPSVPKGTTDPEELYENAHVYSSALTWEPKGNQAERYKDNPPAAVVPNILIAKMRPGQEMLLELHAEKGYGKDHAKWSPVSTASYRLLPQIHILKPIPSQLCEKFAKCFAPGVVEVKRDKKGKPVSCEVVNPRNDTVSREVLRHPEFEGYVKLSRRRDHFIFSIESVGQYPPEDLFTEATKVMYEKAKVLKQCAEALRAEEEGSGGMDVDR